MKHLKLFENYKVNEGVKTWEDMITSSLKGNIYYMPKGTMVLKDNTKKERPSESGMWLTIENSVESDDVVYFRSYPADYTVRRSLLETEPQKDLKKRYLEFKKEQKVGGLKQGNANWGFGDEGEVGSNPKAKEAQEQIKWLDTLISKQ